MKINKTLILITCSFLLAACSSKPSDSDIKPAIIERMDDFLPDQTCFKVANIRKTNGFDRGDGTYQVTANWDLVAIKNFDVNKYSIDCVEKVKFDSMKNPNDIVGWLGMIGEKSGDSNFANLPEKGYLRMIECLKIRKGDSCSIELEMIFRQKEKGWVFVGVPKS